MFALLQGKYLRLETVTGYEKGCLDIVFVEKPQQPLNAYRACKEASRSVRYQLASRQEKFLPLAYLKRYPDLHSFQASRQLRPRRQKCNIGLLLQTLEL